MAPGTTGPLVSVTMPLRGVPASAAAAAAAIKKDSRSDTNFRRMLAVSSDLGDRI